MKTHKHSNTFRNAVSLKERRVSILPLERLSLMNFNGAEPSPVDQRYGIRIKNRSMNSSPSDEKLLAFLEI